MRTGHIKRRWTLGGTMILIALIAVPLALYARHAREVATQQAVLNLMLKDLDKRLREDLKTQANSPYMPFPLPLQLPYFEYDWSEAGAAPK